MYKTHHLQTQIKQVGSYIYLFIYIFIKRKRVCIGGGVCACMGGIYTCYNHNITINNIGMY